MYSPPTFLTPAVLAEILAEFVWPAAFTLEEMEKMGIRREDCGSRNAHGCGRSASMRLYSLRG